MEAEKRPLNSRLLGECDTLKGKLIQTLFTVPMGLEIVKEPKKLQSGQLQVKFPVVPAGR